MCEGDHHLGRAQAALSEQDLAEELEGARWQMAIAKALVTAIEEEIQQLEMAPELDDGNAAALVEDLTTWQRAYLAAALEAASLLAAIRQRRASSGVLIQFEVAVQSSPEAVLAGPAEPLASTR